MTICCCQATTKVLVCCSLQVSWMVMCQFSLRSELRQVQFAATRMGRCASSVLRDSNQIEHA
jgi:hypothetical protein